MKTLSGVCYVFLLIFLLPLLNNCQKAGNVPSLKITGVTDITGNTATINANVTSDGGKGIDFLGICWGTSPNPTIDGPYMTADAGTESFSLSLSNLVMETKYYVRAFATNAEGIGYSPQVTFETALVDYDGNIYHKITIGTQVWMVENLGTLHFLNGDPIPNVSGTVPWLSGTLGACCYYNNDDTNSDPYGILYNGWAVTDSRNIAPIGWHVATNSDYQTLETFLGGAVTAGGKMKEAGTTHWTTPNTGADNSSGFTALPGGYRDGTTGLFSGLANQAYFWTSTTQSGNAIYGRILNYNNANSTSTTANYYTGMSVRCVKN